MTLRHRKTSASEYLSDAFSLLAGWRRDGSEINRTLPLTDAEHAALTERVRVIADALQVWPRICRRDGITLIGIDAADSSELLPSEVQLAARIEDTYRSITNTEYAD